MRWGKFRPCVDQQDLIAHSRGESVRTKCFCTLKFAGGRETFRGMNLDEGQRRKVAEWIEQGLKVAEIQSKLGSELGLQMTYMDVRFLIDDLKLRPKDVEPPPTVTMAQTKNAPAPAAIPAASPAAPPLAGGRVAVTVDQIARAGALVSGRVTFTDGQTAEWHLDQMGRLGMVPPSPGYRPPQADIPVFQQQLQDELAKMGL
jgi:hypothetical protein